MKDILKYAIWVGIYAALVIPFIVANTMFFPYIVGKAFTFRIIVEIILGLWLVLIMKDKEFRPKWSWVLGCVGIFTLVLLAADINAVAPYKAFWSNFERMEGFVTFAHLLAYFLVLGSMFNTEKLWIWFLRITTITPIIYVIIKYFSYLNNLAYLNTVAPSTAHPFSLSGYMEYMGLVGDRWAGPLGNTIYLGVMTLFLACFLLILIQHDVINKKKIKDIFSTIYSGFLYFIMIATFCFIVSAIHGGVINSGIAWWSALIAEIFLGVIILAIMLRQKLFQAKFSKSIFFSPSLYGYSILFCLYFYILATTSRGVLLGFGGTVLIASLLIAIFEKSNFVLKRLSTVVFVIVLLLSLFYSTFVFRDTAIYKKLHLSNIAVIVLNTDFVKNHNTINRLLSVSWSNINGQARQLVWPMAIKGFQEKPILGWGQDGFNYVFNKNYDPRMYNQEQWFDRAHNAPLDFLVAGGILGLLSYLALFGSALYLLWLKRNNLDVTEKSLLTGLFAGYFFQAIFVFDNLVSYIMFFTTLAYVHSRLVEDTEKIGIPKDKNLKESKNLPGHLSAFAQDEEYQNYILIPAVVILTAVGVWWINIPGISANQTLIKALRLIQSGQPALGLQAFKQALSYNSMGDSEIREQLLSYTPSILKTAEVNQELKKEFLTLTVNEVEKQIAKVPNDARYYTLLGAMLNGIGDPTDALVYNEKAIELSPLKQAMRFELVQSLYSLGKSTEAMSEARAAYELEKNYDQAKQVYILMVQNEIKMNPQFKAEGEQILKDLGVN